MKLRGLKFLSIALLIVVLSATPAYAISSKDIQKELMCQCGCTMIVDVCDCETANQIRAKITELMDQGQSKGQIVDYFVKQYGEKMLASPAKKGFNLVAWILPFVVVAVGAAALFFILKSWVRKGRDLTEETVALVQPVSAQETEEYRGRMIEELKMYKEDDSP